MSRPHNGAIVAPLLLHWRRPADTHVKRPTQGCWCLWSVAGKWHVGSKAAFDLFPGPLKHRIRAERKKRFDEQQRAALTAATAAAAQAPSVSPPPPLPGGAVWR